jgi:hypothetical protein
MFTNFRILLRFFESLLLSLEVILAKLKDDLRIRVLTNPATFSSSRLGEIFEDAPHLNGPRWLETEPELTRALA